MGSFNDEYLKLRKKRLEDEEKGKPREILTPYRRPLASDVTNEIKTDGGGDDIAPVSHEELERSRLTKRLHALAKNSTDPMAEEETEKKTWFKKSGLWDDGYQFGDVTKTILAGGQDLIENIGAGIAEMPEKALDALLTVAPYVAQGQYYANGGGYNLQADAIANEMFEAGKKGNAEIVKKDLYSGEDVAKFILTEHNPVSYDNFTGRSSEEDSVLGEKTDELAQSGGQLLGTAALQAVGVPAWLTIGSTAMGGEAENALNNGATLEEAAVSGMISAGAEILTEKISGGIDFGMGTLDDGLSSALAANISHKTLQTLTKLGVDMAGEGAEEVFSNAISAVGQKLTYDKEKDISFSELFLSEEAFENFIGGAVLGGVGSGGKAVVNTVKGNDAVTGLQKDTEQKVVDKLYKEALADAETDGKKLTLKDKTKLYDGVLNNLEKGYISTDVIEEVLGGEDYKTYQNEIKRQQDLDKELNELRNMKSSEMTDIQTERMAELKAMTPNTEMVNALKFGIDEKIHNSIKDTKLVESYNEKARRGQTFEADLSKYDSKQAAVVQKAIDSGILNNTNRTHEFVDMVSKISADKGVLFDFSNNEKLKESGFALEGKTINGFVTKDGVTLNIDSQKSLNTVVGHEIAHVLEGTELYTELSKAITEYAKGKGDYQGRYDSLSALYKGIEGANIDAELTADLVGDYLFTDADFVNNLSVQHRNVFEKIFDEIKYLWNVATAGSKEARELEKVKKVFEKAYKQSGKAQTSTKYSMSDNTGKALTKEQSEYFENSKIRDENGNLKVMHHGTNESFTVFDKNKARSGGTYGKGFYFTDSTSHAATYGESLDVYLNITNPLQNGTNNITKDQIRKFVEALAENEDYGIDNYGYDATIDSVTDSVYGKSDFGMILDLNISCIGDMVEAVELFNKVNGTDYNGIVAPTETVAFYPEQIKRIDNEAPTDNPDIRYSLADSDGKKLSKEQSDYFKDSKMRDDNGNLKVMYHGSQDAGFHVFDPSMSDDGISLFFVDSNDVAASYSGTSETYEAQTIKTAEDMNAFIESIGAEGYEVAENNGKFTLYYEGERVADSNTAKGIYKEFCWYEGVGEGDANYKVYLNLTNPLEIDAKGRPWNKIDAEFSQEIYDKYNSLTPEEKAALVDLAEWEDFRLFNSEVQEARGDAVASAYAKMGEDCNIYDLFSVAADNFSEEAMRENARGYLKTRDYAQRAKDGGYDGVIFKNIHDNGGYSNGSEGASTVAIAFSSEQVKSVANEKPTKDPDIRYSLSEYTAEEKKAHNDAVKNHFGKTYKWAETGYLLLDGTQLDLSGKHDGAPGGYRTVDHRDITEALGYDYGGGEYSDSLIQFMSEGNIRIIPECNGINLSVKPTKAQEQALSNYITRYRGEVLLDIDDLNGNTVVSVEYPYGTYYTKVLNDIREWFENGKKPENSSGYSLTKEGDTPKRYGSYNVYGKDIGLDRGNIAPMQEDISEVENTTEGIAPVTEEISGTSPETVDETYPDGFAPMEHSAMYESEVERVNAEMDRLAEEASRLYSEGKVDEAQAIIEQMQALNESGKDARDKYYALKSQERADAEGYLNSLSDADAPPEIEAPYYEDGGIIDPFDERDVKTVGDRKVKSFMAENPEVKPYFQAEANILLGELNNSVKGERFYTATPDGHLDKDGGIAYGSDSYGVWSGTSRSVTPDIEQLLDNAKGDGKGYSYDEIRAGLEAIIKGDANNACSKRIEFVINDRLMNGYITDGGVEVPANQEYRDLIKSQGVLEGREEAFKQLIKDTNKVERAQMEDIAPLPTFDTASEKQIPGQQTIFEDAKTVEAPIKEAPIKNTAAESTGEEPKIAKVLESTPEKPKKVNIRQKARTYLVDKQSAIEDLALKTGNRELMAKADLMHRTENMAQRYIAKNLVPLREKVEKTGKRNAHETYWEHLHNIDRMSLEAKAAPTLKAYKEKFGHLKLEQIQAIALTKITDKTTEKTANTIREAGEYLKALETKNKPVFGDEITADVSREFVKKFEAENPNAKAISDEVVDYNKDLLNMLVDGGVVSQDMANLFGELYPRYVPIRRVDKGGAAIKVPLDSRKTGVNSPIARATGGNSDIKSVLDTMGSRTEQVYRAVARNRFGLELMHTLNTVTDTQPATVDEVLDSFDSDTDELLKKGENGANPTFTVFEDGKRVTFEITEELYDALKPASFKTEIPGLSHATKVQRALLTNLNPIFSFTNFPKDIGDVILNSKHPIKTYAEIPEAIKELTSAKVGKEGKWISEYLDNGAYNNKHFDSKQQVFIDKSTAKKVLGFVPEKISNASDFVEQIPRLAEYIASRKSGDSIEVAMLNAQRVTTNFAAGGDFTKALNRNGFTFLNASVQGAAQQVRNVREAKAQGLKGVMQLAAKYAVAGLPVLLLNHLIWDDDEEYAELSDYVKDNYYIVGKTEDGTFIRIPKGRAVAVIQNAFEQMENLITGNDEVDMDRFGQLLITNLAPNDPVTNNVVAPIMQAANNKTWYGEDLVPSRLQDMPTAEQFDETTDSVSKWLGENFDPFELGPYKINYLLNQYSGGIGDVALPMLTPESDGSGVLAPFTDKFTTDSTMKNQNVTDFYDAVDELTKNANSASATNEDILKDKYMNTVRTELSELYTQKREIQNSDLTDKEKDEAVREIQEQINAKAKEALDTYGEVEIDGNYATVGDLHYRWYVPGDKSEDVPHWEKITEKQLAQQDKVTKHLDITPSEYWSNKEEYDFAYESPGKYEIAKAIGGYGSYKMYTKSLNGVKGVDEDGDGKSDPGTRKEKVINWINSMEDLDYGQKIILYRSMYNSKQDREDYNYDIIDYLNSRDDINYAQMKAILEELGMTVDSEGYIYWD